ncbi:MFS transporter [Pyrobaculum neutrophilum]|uniref:Major facilitator superfamily MFS_1 n=1 Tax=Pyrobaculum neutrophilum (strain DSM 2338 / JCM 9278 / NBRC 100436 / V24Sta) TaxID=444157 RepID=B1Y9K8_PYRNV|nr:MFS transporter [Pyrobaculum neutrophilum]ACB40437.1 major facilitator superfamily MFS_1 [Pyrobaculum neutrophilum V24Sta]
MGYTSSATNTSRADLRAYVLLSTPYSFVVFLLPFYVLEIGGGSVEVGVAYASYAAAVVVTRPTSGALADKFGRRRVMLLGGATLAVSMALLALSTGVAHVYISLFLAGAASSLVNVAALAYVSDVGGLEDPALYSRLKTAAALGALAGGASIPAVYVLSRLLSFADAFRLVAAVLALLAVSALLAVPGETKHLAARHKKGDRVQTFCVMSLATAFGSAVGLYGPQVMLYLHRRYSLSPYTAVVAYLPSVVSWIVGPRLAGPAYARLIAGGAAMALALVGMAVSPSPYVFSAFWAIESLGVAAVSTSLDQRLVRHVAGSYWGRGYGLYQALYNLGYSAAAAVSGFFDDPFTPALAPLSAALLTAAVCSNLQKRRAA